MCTHHSLSVLQVLDFLLRYRRQIRIHCIFIVRKSIFLTLLTHLTLCTVHIIELYCVCCILSDQLSIKMKKWTLNNSHTPTMLTQNERKTKIAKQVDNGFEKKREINGIKQTRALTSSRKKERKNNKKRNQFTVNRRAVYWFVFSFLYVTIVYTKTINKIFWNW